MAKLNSHLVVKEEGKAFDENVLVFGDIRISVILDGVIRIEKGTFTDEITQSFWKRNHGKVNFTSEKQGNKVIIKTDRAEVCVNLSNGKPVWAKCGSLVSKCNNKKNLKGTARTLDQAKGEVKLLDGVVSFDGAAVVDDSKSLIINESGEILPRSGKAKDIYVFCYGHDYIGAVKALFSVCGESPLIPKYVLGNWWSRYHAYSEQSYIDLMLEFKKRNIPLTVATIDMDWHWVNIKKQFPDFRAGIGDYYIVMDGWTGYSWNTDLFPDYKRFLSTLHSMGLRTTVNLHPANGVRCFEDMYDEMAKEMGVNPEGKKRIDFDITDPQFVNAYFKVLHNPYEENGVDFWWIDWQQGRKTKTPGLDPLWALNHFHYLDKQRDGERPMILSRYAGIGSHRYPLGFSGDSHMSWSALDFQPYFTSTASNCGYTWWSHDIGGHCRGEHDFEMYTRWVQLGVFSPIIRLHSTNNDLSGKEPWNYCKQAENIVSDFMRLRHSLIPYIYSMNRRTNKEGRALCEPLYYIEPEKKEAYDCKNGFMFGSELLVCPVTTKRDKSTGTAMTEVYLPEGRWTNIFNGKIYQGGKIVRVSSELEEMPVFAKEGAVIPMSLDEGNSIANPEKLKLKIYRGNSKFALYEDDGETFGYKNGDFSETVIEVREEKENLSVKVSGGKKFSFMPEKREFVFDFCDIENYENICVKCNGKEVDYNISATGEVTVSAGVESEIEILLEKVTVKTNPDWHKSFINALSRFDAKNRTKAKIYLPMKLIKDKEKLIRHVRKLSHDNLRNQLLEILEDLQ